MIDGIDIIGVFALLIGAISLGWHIKVHREEAKRRIEANTPKLEVQIGMCERVARQGNGTELLITFLIGNTGQIPIRIAEAELGAYRKTIPTPSNSIPKVLAIGGRCSLELEDGDEFSPQNPIVLMPSDSRTLNFNLERSGFLLHDAQPKSDFELMFIARTGTKTLVKKECNDYWDTLEKCASGEYQRELERARKR